MHDRAIGSGTACTSCPIQHKGAERTVAMYVGGRDKGQGMEASVFGMLGAK